MHPAGLVVAPGQDDVLAAHLVDRADMDAVRADHLHRRAHPRHRVGPLRVADREIGALVAKPAAEAGAAANQIPGGRVLAERSSLAIRRRRLGLGGLVAPARAEAAIALPLGFATVVPFVLRHFTLLHPRKNARRRRAFRAGLHRVAPVAIWGAPTGAGL